MTSKVSARGQLVVPYRFRAKYKIKVNSKIEWIDNGKVLTLVPIPDNVIASSRGILKKTSSRILLQQRKEDKEFEEKSK